MTQSETMRIAYKLFKIGHVLERNSEAYDYVWDAAKAVLLDTFGKRVAWFVFIKEEEQAASTTMTPVEWDAFMRDAYDKASWGDD